MISFLKYLRSEIKANESSFNHPVSRRLLPMTSSGFGHINIENMPLEFLLKDYKGIIGAKIIFLLCRTRLLLTYFFPKPVHSYSNG